jgi:hypothetical protein
MEPRSSVSDTVEAVVVGVFILVCFVGVIVPTLGTVVIGVWRSFLRELATVLP